MPRYRSVCSASRSPRHDQVGNSGLGEQWSRRIGVADELEVRVGVGNEVPRRRMAGQLGRTDHAVEDHAPDLAHGEKLPRESVLSDRARSKSNLWANSSSNSCTPDFPLGKVTCLDRVPQVAAMEVRIRPRNPHRLIPHHRLHPLRRLQVALDKCRLVLGVDQPEGVDAEAFHEPEASAGSLGPT